MSPTFKLPIQFSLVVPHLSLLAQEKQAANTCTVHIIYGPVYAYTTGKIRVPVSVTTGTSMSRNGTVLLRELPY